MQNILIADDHPIVAEGLQHLLEKKGHNISKVCNNGLEAYNWILVNKPHIALLDLNMPGLNAIEIMEKLQGNKIKTYIIIYTMVNDAGIFTRAKELGVKGYLLKEFAMSEIEECIKTVQNGQIYFSTHLKTKLSINKNNEIDNVNPLLTFAENKILRLVADQRSNKQIAEQLFITERTVETHRRNIIKKLKLPPGNNSLVLWATKNWKE